MTDEIRDKIRGINKSWADQALRVLAAACRTYDAVPADTSAAALEQSLTLIGLYGMIDPCRPEAAEAIEKCKIAGIRPIMITGDHKDTAVAIGKQLGIPTRLSSAPSWTSIRMKSLWSLFPDTPSTRASSPSIRPASSTPGRPGTW